MSSTAVPRPERARDAALVCLGGVLPLSLAAANVLWAAAALLSLPLLFRRPWRWRPTGVEIPWLAGVVWAVVSALFSDAAGLGHALRSEVLVLVFVLAVGVGGTGSLPRRWFFWTLGAAAVGMLGIVQWFQPWDRGLPSSVDGVSAWAVRAFSNKGGRAVGLYSNAITYAEVLALAGLTALGGVFPVRRGVRWAAIAAAGAGVFFSQTRGVWLAAFGALTLWGLVRRDRKILAVLLGGVLLAVVAVFASPALRHRAASIGDRHHDSSNRIRLGLWTRSIELIRDNPWVGVGPGRARIPAAELRWGGSLPDEIWTEMHNIYLQAAVERGLVGLGFFLWFLAAAGRALWRAQSRDPALSGVFWGFVALLLAGMTESWFNDSEVVMNLYFVLGTALRAAEQKI